jgi:hypothetical protein
MWRLLLPRTLLLYTHSCRAYGSIPETLSMTRYCLAESGGTHGRKRSAIRATAFFRSSRWFVKSMSGVLQQSFDVAASSSEDAAAVHSLLPGVRIDPRDTLEAKAVCYPGDRLFQVFALVRQEHERSRQRKV